MTPPASQRYLNGSNGVREAKVWFVQGKKANRDFQTALALYRENATLSDKAQDDVPEENPERFVQEEAGHNAVSDQCHER